MFMQAFKQAFAVITKKPLRLWGLSLLSVIISTAASLLTIGMPLVGTAFGMVLAAGMSKVYLDGLDGKQVYSDQLFYGFRSGKAFFRTAGGLAWQQLWGIIWGVVAVAAAIIVALVFTIIPFVGGILGILAGVIVLFAGIALCYVKGYAYSFVPYILMTQDVTATEALRISMKMTKGKKLQLWLADLVYGVAFAIATAILGALSAIPFIGVVFILAIIVLFVLSPLFQGLYKAALYKMPQPTVAANATVEKLESIVNQ